MSTVWLLVFISGHSYTTVPNLPSEQECVRLYSDLKKNGWVISTMGKDHQCISYQVAK